MATARKRGAEQGGRRSRFERLVDPFDVAGKAVRLVPGRPPPALAHAVFFGVLGAMAVAELVELPVAMLIGTGHLMVASHNRYLQEVGGAVEEGA
jgi:hypothetical protein